MIEINADKVNNFVKELNELVKKYQLYYQDCCCARIVTIDDESSSVEYSVSFDDKSKTYIYKEINKE